MALTKNIIIDRIEILETGQLQIRQATIILEGGVEVSRTFQRHVLNPGDDTTGQSDRVVAVAAATWTADVVSAWEAIVAANAPT